jgi:hypothetical protein
MAPTSPAEYITCPTDHEVTDAELAEIISRHWDTKTP